MSNARPKFRGNNTGDNFEQTVNMTKLKYVNKLTYRLESLNHIPVKYPYQAFVPLKHLSRAFVPI